ncbi:hypothetical protein FNYG_13241 [Fusarium nygamai]|uniref:AB hydrolase-1 domain-containing protein n=1 Tax=Gibberella nygamai TaxID=42673 RepID=A0A2K0VTS6_GIBNY|nr:hypothetical protein FNYG_13241 [Fusarium nygamai]
MATLVIIPGSFASAASYKSFTDALNRNGVDSEVIDTPSVGRRKGGPKTMSDDAAEITRVASTLLNRGKEVVLMTHSYGGIPGTQSLEKLSKKAREAQGKAGGVEKIIYLTSVVLPVGTSNLETFGSNAPDSLTIRDDYMSLNLEDNAPLTFSDLPAEESLAWAKEMPDHSTASFKEQLTYPGYNDVEVHYIVCEEDKIIPPEHQYGMIEFLRSSTGNEVKVHKLNSGHAPNASKPDNLAQIIKGII